MLHCQRKGSAHGLVDLLWFIATLKAGQQPQASHDQLLARWEKQHPMGRLNFTARSIPWRFGGHGFDVFKSYGGRALGAAPLCG